MMWKGWLSFLLEVDTTWGGVVSEVNQNVSCSGIISGIMQLRTLNN